MKTPLFILLGSWLLAMPMFVSAQYTTLKIADREFEAFNFASAVTLYEEAFQKRQTVKAMKGLAASYYQMRDFRKAQEWYGKLANLDKAEGADILYYAHTLRSNANFREAKAQYERLAQREDRPVSLDELRMLAQSCDSATVWMQRPHIGHDIENLQVLNSQVSEFGAIQYGDQVLFASDRGLSRDGNAPIYGWTGHAFLEPYRASIGSPSQSGSLNPYSHIGPVERHPFSWYDATHHVGPVSISSARNEVYFSVTRALTRKERRKASRTATVNIEIFSNDLTAEDWGLNARPFRYNRITDWSVGDPFISMSGDTLYFVSDMPGGLGGTDVYYCLRQTNGDWGDAINMGPNVNTSGNERFPSVDETGTFYFSSDGHLGMGGLDIFVLSKGPNPRAINLGYPINSPADDFSARFTRGMQGLMASNRMGGKGADDIYRFDLDRKIRVDLQGTVLNAASGLPVAGATVRLEPISGEEDGHETSVYTHADGTFTFNLKPEMQYKLQAAQTGFKPFEPVDIDTRGMDSSQTIFKELRLVPVEKEEVVVLRNIYFDFDKSDIRPDAAYELSKILSFLNSDPTVRIELSAHTDSRGSADYNMRLSQRRAESVVAFLTAGGIDPDRLVAKGYGFSRLANDCGPGVECTEEEHQFNRRVEFFVK